MTRRNRKPGWWLLLVVAISSIGVAAIGVVPAQSAGPGAATEPPRERRQIYVKLSDDDRIRVRSGEVRALGSREGARASAITDRRAHLIQLLLDANPASAVSPLFIRPEAELDAEHARFESEGRQIANPNSFLLITVPAAQDAEGLLAALRRLPGVEDAGLMPEPAPLPSPDFTAQQVYQFSTGLDASLPSPVAGASGGNVTVADVEYSWNRSHEDLAAAAGPDVPLANGTPADPFTSTDHGTAVLGVLAGTADAQGVTGLVPDATLRLVNAYSTSGYDLTNAISLAASRLAPGDVILIEQQTYGPNGCGVSQFGCVAVEWNLPVYTAIKSAVAAGIHVVEAAGNGAQNLDDQSLYGNPFPVGRPDSGAILVGAGGGGCTTPVGSRMSFSNYGARIDVQAWGECVTTTGYGYLFSGGANALYTGSFGGTSSASAEVAGAVAIVSSVAKQQGLALSPAELRQLLRETGQTSSALIGPSVRVRAALYRFVPRAVIAAPLTAKVGRTVTLDGSASSEPQGSPLIFGWDLDGDGTYHDASASITDVTLPSTPGTVNVSLRVTDPFGATDTTSWAITALPEGRNRAPVVTPSTTTPPRASAPLVVPPSTTPRGPVAPTA